MAVFGCRWGGWAGGGGFRWVGWGADDGAELRKSSADACGGQLVGLAGAFPWAAEVLDEFAGEA